MLYRRGNQAPSWHFCQNCPGWPTADYEEQTIEPRREALCPECVRKTTELTCEVRPEEGVS